MIRRQVPRTLDSPIDVLDLPQWTIDTLYRARITTVRELARADLSNLGFRDFDLHRIRVQVASFKPEIPPPRAA